MSATPSSTPLNQPRRKYRIGGFCISSDVAGRWGSQLFGEELHPIMNSCSIRIAVLKKTFPWGINFRQVGEDLGGDWMLITQGAKFDGYKDMNPDDIPKFVPGEKDVHAERLLKEAGIKEYKFATVLD